MLLLLKKLILTMINQILAQYNPIFPAKWEKERAYGIFMKAL